MTDPLGQSQVIPYLIGLSNAGYEVTLLSCEKTDKLASQGSFIKELLQKNNIKWEYIIFTAKPPILAKYFDLFNLKRKATQLYHANKFALVHCRSYVSADVGLYLKKRFKIKFIFDIRGFWVDERVDGGLWNLNNPIYKFAYKTYKKKEADYVANADVIVSLTENGKIEMQKWDCYSNTRIDIIPCCADYELFSIQTQEEKANVKIKLGFDQDAFILSYLGSIGTWYMLNEMLDFFKLLKLKYTNAKFLFISNGDNETILNAAAAKGIATDDIKIINAKRSQVPELIKASSLSLSFIKTCYSKKSSSPTKLGELLAMGIPVICNKGIGDVDDIVRYTNGGLLIDDFTEADYKTAIDNLENYFSTYDPEQIREKSRKYYDLVNGIEKYKSIYSHLIH